MSTCEAVSVRRISGEVVHVSRATLSEDVEQVSAALQVPAAGACHWRFLAADGVELTVCARDAWPAVVALLVAPTLQAAHRCERCAVYLRLCGCAALRCECAPPPCYCAICLRWRRPRGVVLCETCPTPQASGQIVRGRRSGICVAE